MSIDGIGKPSGLPGSLPPADAPGARPAGGASFEIRGPEASAAAPGGSDALGALERGEISVEQYLDTRVESAVAPLLSKLSPDQLEFVRAELRSALETDPVLVELVRKTTSGVTSAAR
jgi:hypothetical protein